MDMFDELSTIIEIMQWSDRDNVRKELHLAHRDGYIITYEYACLLRALNKREDYLLNSSI